MTKSDSKFTYGGNTENTSAEKQQMPCQGS